MPFQQSLPRFRFALAFLAIAVAEAAADSVMTLKVTDTESGEPVEYAGVRLNGGDTTAGGLTDADGLFVSRIAGGTWRLEVSAMGYRSFSAVLTATGADTLFLHSQLVAAGAEIGEVVVTARESRGLTSASIIDREAMTHLQPSSFTDLLELLPGNVSKDPDMSAANLARIRTAGNAGYSDDYAVSSLGTSFIIDGVPVNTNAEMNSTPDSNRSGRTATGKGVDMRGLSTDDIESVEIVRGIASAEYGETTSGVINIKRKNKISRLEARFKADMQSQLFYAGKGVRMPGDNWIANFSADWLDSKIDPRNNRENFKRVTVSARSDKKWAPDGFTLDWNTAIGYKAIFERDKNDPDLTVNNTRDHYTSTTHSGTWTNTLQLSSTQRKFFISATLATGVSCSFSHLHQEKTVASNRLYPMPVSLQPGSNYVDYLPMVYEGVYDVYGKPLTLFVKADTRFRYRLPFMSATIKAGAEWSMSKNLGDGAVYDITRPITAGNTSRPRPFSDIPAMHILSFYAEHLSELTLGEHSLQLSLGLRETGLLNLDRRYRLRNRPHFDPRVNLKWTLPVTFVNDNPVTWEIGAGTGWHTKMPVAAMLYPDLRYTDFTQLNYFHDNESFRAMNVMTFVEDLTNFSLKAARNLKWELRGGVTFMNNRLSVTYFRERLNDGFRNEGTVRLYTYNKYDASGFDPVAANRPPVIEELPFVTETRIAVTGQPSNSSCEKKEGVEFTFSSRRIPAVRTRITVSGAWFRTTRHNSTPLWYKPSIILNNKEIHFAGLYDDLEGMTYESFNTNFTFDTDIPRLRLNFSLTAQCSWFSSTRTLPRGGIPTHYTGTDGIVRPFTADCLDDPYLKNLVRTYSATAFDRHTVPAEASVNLKATKRLWGDRAGIALFVNRLLSITPDYYLYGILRRRYSSPYFGMELNLKI